jgi:predicted DNA-binding protein
MASCTTRLQVRLDEKTDKRLWDLHARTHKNKTELVREAINHLFETKYS